MKHSIRSFLALALVVACASAVQAQERFDGIAAVVNDDVILQSDVEEQLYLFLSRAQTQPDSAAVDTLRRQVLDQLIDEKLIVAEAKKQGITVPDAEVEKEVGQAISDVKTRLGGEAGYQEQLAKENTTEDELRQKYRDEVRRQLLAQKLLQKELPQKPVTAAEAEAYFKANTDKFPRVPAQLELQVIQVPLEPDSAAVAAGKSKIVAAEKRIKAGEKFARVATDVSEDPGSAHAGGDLGYIGRGALDQSIEDVVFSLPVGTMSEPVRSPFGWHLIQVLDRDTLKTSTGADSLGDDGKPAIEVHARHILIRVPVSDADAKRAQALADKARAEAMAGTDFGALVRKYSKYEGKQDANGDIGFVSLAALQPHIRAGLENLPVGGVSEVLANQIGYNIFKVVARKPERPYQLDEIRKELPEVVSQMKYKDRYDQWVSGLRAKAHIEIRNS